MPDQIYKVTWNGAEKVKYTYDKLGRLESKHTGSFDTNFTYEDYETIGYNGATEKRTTTLVKSVETPTGTYTYTYDKLGNILNVTDGTYTTSYEYDSLNQLTRVNDEKAGKTTTYSYTNGNITSQSEYPYNLVGVDALIDPNNTKTWEYNDSTWSDLLTNFNGESITYDEIGNPLTIGNKEFSWTGRQLQSITDSDTEIAYTYNGDGLRTSKTVSGETTNYYYNGSILAGQKSGDDTLVFMYDNNSDIFGVIYNDTEYYYIKNAQNDVIGIADKDGNVLIKYAYDAWGKITSITKADNTDITDLEDDISQSIFDIATGESTPVLDENGNPVTSASTEVTLARINPILYRSYYYDKETEWYYLNTRYYSPDMCRFINADGIVGANQDILAYNMFAYCSNDPINNCDSNGQGKLRNWFNQIKNWVKNRWNDYKSSSSSSKLNTLTNNVTGTISKTITGIKNIYKKTSRPNNIGKGTFAKQIADKTRKLTKAVEILDSPFVGFAIDVGTSVIGDVIDKEPMNKVLNNAMTELMFGVAGFAVGYYAASASLSLMFAMSSIIAISNPFTAAIAIGGIATVAFGLIVDCVPIDGMSIKDKVKKVFNEAG